MMLSVLVWLAMQGQQFVPSPTPRSSNTLEFRSPVNDAHLYICGVDIICDLPPKPAEHVIEIKTRRKLSGNVRVCYFFKTGKGSACDVIPRPNPLYCPKDATCEDDYRVTRELWIDGVRWGVVKGLE